MSPLIRHCPRPLAAAIDASLHAKRLFHGRTFSVFAGISVLALALGYPANAAMADQTYVVTTTGDPGPAGTLSLRQAVELANAAVGNTVQFDPSLFGSTITLADGEIAITQTLTMIVGPGSNLLTVSGDDKSRIFNISGGSYLNPVLISGLTLAHGRAYDVEGGAIKVTGRLALFNSVISSSTASRGGGLSVSGGILDIRSSTIDGNGATAYGGGIYAFYNSDLEIENCTISGNTAGLSGGGIFSSYGHSLTLDHSLVSFNSLGHPSGISQSGGGIALKNSPAYVVNSTISGNFSPDGGGGGISISNVTYPTTINYSTIAENATSTGSDNGIYAVGGANNTITHSILANNFSAANDDDLAGTFEVDYSLIRNRGGAVITGTGSLFGFDPELGPLRANGGPTLTMLPAATSPVIDSLSGGGPSSDQRYLPRGELADMGAVERQYPEVMIFGDGFDGP